MNSWLRHLTISNLSGLLVALFYSVIAQPEYNMFETTVIYFLVAIFIYIAVPEDDKK